MKFFLSPIKNKETKHSPKKLKSNGYFPQVIYMQNERSEKQMMNALKDGDVLELQADSIPWVLGGENVDERTDFSPFSLAEYFEKLFADKNIEITIDLRCCNSGTIATGPKRASDEEICFARDLSQALNDLGFNQITVYGYTAYIHSNNVFKQSAVAEGFKHGAKVPHCVLEHARVVYKDGLLISDSLKKLVFDFSYGKRDLEKDSALKNYMTDKLEHQAKLTKNKLDILQSENDLVDELLQEDGSISLLFLSLADASAESKENILDAINRETVDAPSLEKKPSAISYI
ncbi:hypothetical protein CC99x_005425 [Candidatus Berkiella cookevillensis]|uniref:Uncharacterized protein n=1 Tax=Candidatus Berkiella cookevillensis TaxID=437022 RepID=A0A0Q9YHN6_9GAMM|nr:hypothetical protein [Candidatus Berkiella cookevillensis]MCS5708342.1 hypothetical protein [Candidatus Berkiella cookevillensis]